MNKETRYLAAYYAILFVVGLMAGCMGPALPLLASHTGSSLSQVSVIFSMRPAGYLLGTLLAGRLFDRVPGHPLLMAALALGALSLFLTPQMSTLAALTLLVMLLGFADGTLDVGANTLLPWVYGERVGPYFNGLHFVFGLGALVAPILIERSLHFTGGMQGGFTWMALLTLPFIVALGLIPSPRHQTAAPTAAAVASASPPLTSRLRLALIVMIFFAYGGSEASFGNWIFSYAKARALADDAGAAYLSSLFWSSLTLARLASIPIAIKARPQAVLMVDALICVISLGALLLWPSSRAVLWLATAGAGIGMASFFPTMVTFAGRMLSPDGRVSGSITSFFFVGSSSGCILIPWLIGQGFESRGPGMAPGVIFGAVLSMGILLLFLLRRHD